MGTIQPKWVLGAALCVLGTWNAAVQAADSAKDSLEEVVVTAEKRATDLQKTAISIKVTSGETLREEGKRRIDEIMRDTSGVEFQTNAFGSNVFMRGLGNVEGIPGGGEKAVATIIDGAYQYRSEVLSNGTLDVAQVEVMRGAQSTTLGASSLSGAVSLVSNKPVFQYQASGSIEGGNYDLVNTEGVLNLPLTSTQAVRLAYSTAKRDGYVSSGAGGTDNTNARAKYRWQPDENLEIIATYNFQKSFVIGRQDTVAASGYYRYRQSGDSCTPPYANGIDRCLYGTDSTIVHVENGVGFRDRSDPWNDGFPRFGWPDTVYRYNLINTFSSDINWNLGFGTLTVTPQIQSVHANDTEEPSAMGDVTYLHEDEIEKSRQIEARLASASGGRLSWLAGAYYYYRNTPSLGGYTVDLTTAETTYGGMGFTFKNDATTKSLFGNGSFALLDTLRLIGGLRYSKDDKSSSTATTFDGARTDNAFNWSKTTYRAGLEFDVLPESMLYATYQTGYQPGSLDTMSSCGADVGATCAQTTEQSTLGIKNQFFDKRLQLNLEAFNMVYHNRPFQGTLEADLSSSVLTTDCAYNGPPPGPSFVVNDVAGCARYLTSVTVPKWTSRGADLDVSWLPSSADRVDVTAEYLQAKMGALSVNFAAADLLAAGASAATAAQYASILNSTAAQYAGLVPQNSPKFTASATYQHRFALPGGSSLTPKLTGIYKTRYWSQGGAPGANIVAPGAAWQDNFTKWELYTSWDSADGKWVATGYVKNLANKVIQINYQTQDVQLDAPRTFGVIVNASF